MLGRSPIERRQHVNMTIDVDSNVKQHIQTIDLYDRIPGSNNIFTLVSQMLGAGLESTLARAVMMQLGKGPSKSVAVTLHGDGYIIFAWLLVLRGVNMPCSRTTRCCQCHGDRSHDLSIRIPMLYHYVTTLPIYFMFVCLN